MADGLGLPARRAGRPGRPVRVLRPVRSIADHAGDRLLERLPVAAAYRALRGHRLVARLSGHLDLDAGGGRPRAHRDRNLRPRVPAADRQRRLPEHPFGVHAGRGRHQACAAGDGVLPAGVRGVRSGGTAGRGDARSETDNSPGGPAVGGPDRHLLHLQHVCRDRVLRPRKDARRVLRLQQRRPVERDGQRCPAGHRRDPRDLRDPEQFAGKRERRRKRVNACDLCPGPGEPAAALVRRDS